MNRLVIAAALVAALGACGTDVDDRPQTVEYITMAILAPACANAQCHSAFAQVKGYAFDTVEHAKAGYNILVVPGDADSSLLYQVLIREAVDGELPRMPYDTTMPNADIELIQAWIDNGAEGL